jgi:hypothetical protein
MTTANVTRIGQINASGGVDELFLKVFAGEVLTAFETANVMMGRHLVKTITSGKSAQFPRFGKTEAEYHTVGTQMLGQNNIKQAEVVIPIDDLLVTHQFIANIDEAKAHYDARSIYSSEMGIALANQLDKHLLQLAAKAAREANVVDGLPGGSQVFTNSPGAPSGANFMVDGEALAYAIFLAAQELDQKDVPDGDRVCFVRPAQYYALVRAKDNINRDWGGMGSYADGDIMRIAGITIVKTNHLPQAAVANGTVAAGTGNRYAGDFSNTAAVVMQKTALGTVKLFDLGMEAEYKIDRQGTLMVAKYAMGHGILRPEAAVEIVNAASA